MKALSSAANSWKAQIHGPSAQHARMQQLDRQHGKATKQVPQSCCKSCVGTQLRYKGDDTVITSTPVPTPCEDFLETMTFSPCREGAMSSVPTVLTLCSKSPFFPARSDRVTERVAGVTTARDIKIEPHRPSTPSRRMLRCRCCLP